MKAKLQEWQITGFLWKYPESGIQNPGCVDFHQVRGLRVLRYWHNMS
jgi:hypothetical protein